MMENVNSKVYGAKCNLASIWEAHFARFPAEAFFSNGSRVLFMGPTSTLFSKKKNSKIGSNSIIHTFKNYFTTVFSVFNFQQ